MTSLSAQTPSTPDVPLPKRLKRAVRVVTRAARQWLVDHSPPWLRRRLGPAAKTLDMLFVDHGIFRLFYLNLHRISPVVWRSAQPAPHDIARLKAAGLRTVINLRGERLCGSYWLEKAACERLGIRLIDFTVYSRAAPSREQLHAIRALFETVEYPILMHCKSGADRVGLMSTLFLLLHEGVPLAEARRQLSLRYGHIRQADTGILDAVFNRYEADTAVVPGRGDPGGPRPMPFFEWVDTVYDPAEMQRTFRASGFANRLVNSVLRRE